MKFKLAPITLAATLALAAAGVSTMLGATPASADPGQFNGNAPYQIAQAPLWQPYHGEWRKLTEHGYEYRTDAPNYRPGVVSGAYGRYGGSQALWQPYHGEYRRLTEHGYEYRSDAPDYRPGVVTNNYNHGYGSGYSNSGRYYNGNSGYGAYNNGYHHGYARTYSSTQGYNGYNNNAGYAHNYGGGNFNNHAQGGNFNNHSQGGGFGGFGHHHH